MTTTPPSSFNRDFAASLENESHPAVLAAIKQCFPGALKAHRAHPQNDRIGIDIWLEYQGGRMSACDIKIRTIDYGAKCGRPMDAVLEISFGDDLGWALKPCRTDVFLIVCIDTGRAVAFRAADLRLVLEAHQADWLLKYRTIRTNTSAWNGGTSIMSEAVCVPVDVLQAAIDQIRGAL